MSWASEALICTRRTSRLFCLEDPKMGKPEKRLISIAVTLLLLYIHIDLLCIHPQNLDLDGEWEGRVKIQ